MMLNSIEKGPLVYGTIEENGVTRNKTYEELTNVEKLQDDCDVKATNIILQGLPPDVYSLVNHHYIAKEILDRVKLLMFASVKGESLHEYYLRFTQNDMHTIGMTMQQMYYSEQPTFDPALDIEITSDINIISYDQCLKETESAAIQNTASTEQQNVVIMSVFEEITNRVAKFNAEVKDFDNGLHNELNELKTIFNQMEAAVEQCSVDKKCFEIKKKELYLENDRLLELIISQDIVHTVVNSLSAITDCESMRKSYFEEYNRNLTLKAELLKVNELSKTCSRLQNHCISLELKLQ
ncbi:hypothetical protein Tco_0981320 [Tanacetum coccineum]